MTKNTYIRNLLIAVISGIMIFFVSCKNDKEEIGAPVIKGVHINNPLKVDSTFTEANPGKLIVINGENFDGLQQVLINDANVYVNANFVTSTNIIVTIPDTIPTALSNPNVPNTIRLITNHGEATFNFKMVLGAPVVTGFLNESPVPGDTLVVLGTNLFALDSVVFPGNIKVSSGIVTNLAGLVAKVPVPSNFTGTGTVRIAGQFGRTVSTVSLNDPTGTYCNFDDKGSLSWGCNVISNDPAFPGASGKFANLKFTNVGTGDWSWWNGGRSANLNAGLLIDPANMNDPIDNYVVKFDIFVASPWSSGEIFVLPQGSWTYVYRYCPWKVNNKRTVLKTSRWQTVVVPLSAFLTKKNGLDGSGDPASSLSNLFGSGNASINFLFVNASLDESNADIKSQPIASFNAGIDNIKVVKIK